MDFDVCRYLNRVIYNGRKNYNKIRNNHHYTAPEAQLDVFTYIQEIGARNIASSAEAVKIFLKESDLMNWRV